MAYSCRRFGAPPGVTHSTVPELPLREVSIISAAERIGQLRRGLRRVLHERRLRLQGPALDDWTFYRAYPLVMIVTHLVFGVTLSYRLESSGFDETGRGPR